VFLKNEEGDMLLGCFLFVTLSVYALIGGFHVYNKDFIARRWNVIASVGLGIIHLSIPFALWHAITYGFSWLEIVAAVGTAMLGGLGVTLGLHRMAVHGSFQCKYEWMRYVLFTLAALSGQRPDSWIDDHHDHHDAPDTVKDVHSPYFPFNGGVKGLWFAHMGWILHKYVVSPRSKKRRERMNDPAVRRVSSMYPVILVGGILLPGIMWGYPGILLSCIRLLISIHMACSVNSIGHMFGETVEGVRDQSKNVWWLAIATLGESFHAHHHHVPSRAAHGIGKYDIDITKWVIMALERWGLVHSVKWEVAFPKIVKIA
jgi:stearoyl-CoA desaturase (Delta-9 desaturase)